MCENKRKEIYKYEAPWQTYSMNWSRKKEKKFRVAVGSFIEEYGNKVLILSLDEDEGEFREVRTFSHPYPTTKIVWIPDHKGVYPDLLATSGDYLRIWRIKDNNEVVQECRLNTDLTSSFCAPITSFDWNEIDPNILTTCTIDTTCTIWSLETQQRIGEVSNTGITATKKNQIVAHDKEVYDIAFSSGGNGKDIFATVGGDGSLRLFDLRNLLNSTILYEDRNKNPLLRVAWNKQDPNHIATFGLDSNEVLIFDIRHVNVPVAKLQNHKRFVNGISWAPHSSCHICSVSDDSQALIWDIQSMPRSIDDPILAYTAGGEINQVQWSSEHLDWIAICYKNCLELLRV